MKKTELSSSVILSYIRSTTSVEEKACVEAWLKENTENEHILQQIASIYYASRTQERIAARNPEAAYNKVWYQLQNRTHKIRQNRIYTAVACFIGVLILSTALSYFRTTVSDTQQITVQANAGMRTHLNLPDGTIVYLNSGSTLSYPISYDKKERRVTLLGEAYFKVVHNPEQPFVVSASNDQIRVKVLGTEFNLRAYETENNIEATLISGSVLLEARQTNKIARDTKLIPTEKAIYDLITGTLSVEKVNTECDTAWIDGRLMFKNQPLPQVLRDLSHFYNVKFKVQDSVINSYCFTGTFENKQLSQVLDYLKISSQIDYTIEEVASDDSSGVLYTTVILKKNK